MRRIHKGFSLIEVLAAMLLIGIVLPVAMRGYSLSVQLAAQSKQTTESAALGDSKLNELVATGDWKLGLLSGDFEREGRPDMHWKGELRG